MPYLLHTKIQLPPLRPQHTHRERLLKHLQTAHDTQIILVSAPAGFGKSSCLIEWAHALHEQGTHIAWYSLDAQDNDPARFKAYLMNTFRRIGGLFDALPVDSENTDLQDAINTLVNLVSEHEGSIILILDDYHLITAPQIHDAIGRLCEYLPENIRLAIGTRADPPIQLARLRASGAITEIRMGELRFDREELIDWLQSTLGWLPSQQSITQLEKLTEGWAAALSLIIMMLNKQQNSLENHALETLLARYSQTSRHIFDYFAQEVLEQQPTEIRQFLLDTCVLNQLHPHLCSALSDSCAAPLILNRLASESLFIIPLSDTEPIYRYHHLFEQFLCHHLEMKDQARYFEQHRLAAEWYAEHDDIVAAVPHALSSTDYAYAATLIEEHAWQSLTSRGEIMTLIGWLTHFPEDTLQNYPRLCLYLSRAMYLTGNIDQSEHYIQIALHTLNQDDRRSSQQEALYAIALNYQATLAAYQGDIETSTQLNNQAMQLSDRVEGLDRARIANTDAYLNYLRGNVPAARTAYEKSLALAEALNHHYLMLDGHYYLAQLDLLAGHLQAAQVRCRTILKDYTSRIAPLSTIMLPLASVYYERNQIVDAEAVLLDAIALAQRGNVPDILWSAYLLLTRILVARGQYVEALENIQNAREIGHGFNSPLMISLIGAVEAQIALKSGQIEQAVNWSVRYQEDTNHTYLHDYEDMTLVRVLQAQGHYTAAQRLLDTVIESTQASGRIRNTIEATILRALLHQTKDDIRQALDALENALTLASPHGFVRLFVDEGPPMQRLLRLAVEEQIVTDYATYLLDRMQDADALFHPADALTEREIEVLQQIAAGASNQDIARILVISLGTVKSHVHHIMNKLNAQNRTEAVSKARTLNILPD